VVLGNIGTRPVTGLTLNLDGTDAFWLQSFELSNGWQCKQPPERASIDIGCVAPRASIAPGGTTTLTIQTRAEPTVTRELPFTITARVGVSGETETDTSNNTRDVSGTVLADQSPPLLVAIAASPTTVTPGGTVKVNARLRDENAGVRGARLCYQRSGRDDTCYELSNPNPNRAWPEGDWTAKVDISSDERPGTRWSAVSLVVTDIVGNSLKTDDASLSHASFDVVAGEGGGISTSIDPTATATTPPATPTVINGGPLGGVSPTVAPTVGATVTVVPVPAPTLTSVPIDTATPTATATPTVPVAPAQTPRATAEPTLAPPPVAVPTQNSGTVTLVVGP
jgi:hypothetical protein